MGNYGIQYPIQQGQKIILKVAGDLRLTASSGDELLLYARRSDAVRTRSHDNLVDVFCTEDLDVQAPAWADLRVDHVGGDAVISGMAGSVEIGSVGGDFKHQGGTRVDVSHVGGDASISAVSGDVAIQRVGGELTANIPGVLAVDMVGGDCMVSAAGIRLRCGGDVDVRLTANTSEEVNLKAGGDATLVFSEGSMAILDLTSGNDDIRVDVGGQRGRWEQGNLVFTLGEGGPLVRVKAGGDIEVIDQTRRDVDLQKIFSKMESEISQETGQREIPVRDAEYWQSVEERVQERTREAARRAEERVKEAMERVEKANQRGESAFEKLGRKLGFTLGGQPTPPISPVPPVPTTSSVPPIQASTPIAPEVEEVTPVVPSAPSITNEERMLVLKMVQEHKITVEEAEELLAELEGRF